jgi:hypothetical protein
VLNTENLKSFGIVEDFYIRAILHLGEQNRRKESVEKIQEATLVDLGVADNSITFTFAVDNNDFETLIRLSTGEQFSADMTVQLLQALNKFLTDQNFSATKLRLAKLGI